jgi:diguanylate cyclase (GGDEF)-like protein
MDVGGLPASRRGQDNVISGRALARSAGCALAYLVASLLGRATLVDGTGLSLVWPAAGVAVVWFAVQRDAGTRWADLVALVGITFTLGVAAGSPLPLAAWFAAADAVQVLAFHHLLTRWCPHLWGAGGRQPMTSLREFGQILAATVVSTGGGGLIGPAATWAHTGHWSWLDASVWVARDSAAVVLLATVGLRLGQRLLVAGPDRSVTCTARRPTGWRIVESALVLLCSTATCLLVFVALRLPLAFVPIALVVWVALRFDTTLVALYDLLLAATAAALTLAGHGPFAAVDDGAVRILVLQAFLGVLSIVGMSLALSRDERQTLITQIRNQARQSEQHAARMQVLASASRNLAGAQDARAALCAAAREIAGADGVFMIEPDDEGNLIVTVAIGMDPPPIAVAMTMAEPSITSSVLRSGAATFLADLEYHRAVSARLRAMPELSSAAWQPVVGEGSPIGVIVVVYRDRVSALPPHVPAMLETLASEAAGAIGRADLLNRLALAADRDPLTGLANRRRWDEILPNEIARAERSGGALSVALVDLDRFKLYNDTFGHLAGDTLLRDFAAAASECLRSLDTIARWGGEEFALALPGCTAEDARVIADRIRGVVPADQTCTIGVAQWQPGLSAAEVLAQADAALYQGKQDGRDVTGVYAVPADPQPADPEPADPEPADPEPAVS